MANRRSWTWVDDPDLTEDQMDDNEPLAQALADRWNAIQMRREDESFHRQWERDEDGGPEFNSESEARRYEANRQAAAIAEGAELYAIEEAMAKLGVRMTRAYEHHGELESYYQQVEGD